MHSLDTYAFSYLQCSVHDNDTCPKLHDFCTFLHFVFNTYMNTLGPAKLLSLGHFVQRNGILLYLSPMFTKHKYLSDK